MRDELPPKFVVTYTDTAYGETDVSFFDSIEAAEGYAMSLCHDRWRDITIFQRIAKVEAKPVLVR